MLFCLEHVSKLQSTLVAGRMVTAHQLHHNSNTIVSKCETGSTQIVLVLGAWPSVRLPGAYPLWDEIYAIVLEQDCGL